MKRRSQPIEGVPGWFGKLPSLGDFATRRLPDAFVCRWDDWLQHTLPSTRWSQLDADRDFVPCRFWIGPELVSPASWTGVIAPGHDRVGRRFPLTIALPLAAETSTLSIALAANAWYAAMEFAARRLVDECMSIGQFEQALAAAAAGAPASEAANADGTALAAELLRGAVAMRPVADDPATTATRGSIWWHGEGTDSSGFLCMAALPDGESLDALLAQPSPHAAAGPRR